MTVKKVGINEISRRGDVNVWRCETCNKFHFKAGNVLLTFTTQEFSAFINET